MKTEVYPAFVGARILHYRKLYGLTLPRLSKRSGVSKGQLSKIENLKGNPSVSTLAKLAKGLRIHPASFWL